ncbi:hypothetical protein [Nocardioides sp.]|uniref:hypothetical protein n=1 Tax=Nocardioides sp. TaxID=35761 RepID=UPI002C0040D0|nr:hypothetical protein [Nocardioides sp.]HVX55110.1 hypothetical protein [Nocardioides sp.]
MAPRRKHFAPPAFSTARPGLVRPVTLDRSGVGGPTPRQARGRRWRRVAHGRYVPSWVDATDVDQRIVEAASVLPAHGAITGWAALRWSGVGWYDDATRPIPVVVPDHCLAPRAGLLISEEQLAPKDLTVVEELPCTTLPRAVCFEMRFAPDLRSAVRHLDLAAAADLVSIEEAWAYAMPYLCGWTGIDQCRRAIQLADENVWSPMETEMRLLWLIDLGMTRVRCNQPVFDLDGNFVGTPDLIDLEGGIAGEYDGALHLLRRRRDRDIAREAAFRRIGLEYVTMTAADRPDPTAFLQRTLDARQRARRNPRRWTAEPPAWWVPTMTVAQRRALTEEQRRRWLPGRAA